MIVWIIIIVLLLLFLILPVGVDAAYAASLFTLKAKAGPLKIKLLPKKDEPPKPKKEKKPKPKREKETKPKPKLTLDDILELADIALKALSRLRKNLSVDIFMLHVAVAADDPYDAVLRFGYLNAGLGALSPPLHRALKIREEDIRICVDLEPGATRFEARIVATLQIWEILYIGLCAAFAFLRWRSGRKRAAKLAAREAAKNETKG